MEQEKLQEATEAVEVATNKKKPKRKTARKNNFSPQQIEVLTERLAKAREKKRQNAMLRKEIKKDEMPEDEDTIQPPSPKPVREAPSNKQPKKDKKGYCKIVFYEKPTEDDFDQMKIKFKKNKKPQPTPPPVESEESEEESEDEMQQPQHNPLDELARHYFG